MVRTMARAPVLGDPAQPTVWEGRRISLATTASGNRLPTISYRVTPDTLHWTSGRFGTRAQAVPLWAVRDLELSQRVTQRARRVGTITVSLQHPDYTSAPTFVLLEDIEHPQDALRLVRDAARACRRSHDADRS
jgi:hypothetical protein